MPSAIEPRVRRLTVLGQDPALQFRGGALTVEVTVPMERLDPGPKGPRVHVVDFDASTDTLYRPVKLDGRDPYAGVTDIEQLLTDPGFHAQNVYGIVMATIGRFEHALGRRAPFAFRGGGIHPGDALRKSAELEPQRTLLGRAEFQESHRRGEVMVAAMMNAFLDVWMRRVAPLGRNQGRSVDRGRVVEEGASAAGHLLTMAIRALDYAPPVDLQFSDYLSALLTADHELFPDDGRYQYRATLLDWFGRYGIDPMRTKDGVERGAWSPPDCPLSYRQNHFESMRHDLHRPVSASRKPTRAAPKRSDMA